jgi:DinB superfamily
MFLTKKTLSWAALLSCSLRMLSADPLSQHDREHLIAHLQMTASWLPDEVSSLSDAQLNFRSTPGSWTIAEVVQHLVISEPNYWKLFRDGMDHPAQVPKNKPSDADVLWYGIDRTRHDKTPAKQDPQGQRVNIPEALAKFGQLHSKILDYASKTSDDLRGHTVPEWGVDAYQCLLEISTHEQRHILQIREIKANPGFPKPMNASSHRN